MRKKQISMKEMKTMEVGPDAVYPGIIRSGKFAEDSATTRFQPVRTKVSKYS